MSTLRTPLTLLAAFVLSACTAILVPDVDDDSVARCDLSSDCPEIEDNRYVAVCVFGATMREDADKVCSSAYDKIPCGGNGYAPTHPLSEAYLALVLHPELYGDCAPDLLGQRGCGPGPEGCASGLELNEDATCDLPGAAPPALAAGQRELETVIGRDLQDQFCRSYFCDERFVCDNRGERPTCALCDPERSFGRGGCATLYLDGAPSPVYTPVELSGNCEGDMPSSELEFNLEHLESLDP